MAKPAPVVEETPAIETSSVALDASDVIENMPNAALMASEELQRVSETITTVAEKKRGRPKGSGKHKIAQPVAANQPAVSGESMAIAIQLNALFNVALIATLGEDSALNKPETDAANLALANYMAANNVQMTPAMLLTVTYGGIVMTRITTRPTARGRISVAWAWIKSHFVKKPKQQVETINHE